MASGPSFPPLARLILLFAVCLVPQSTPAFGEEDPWDQAISQYQAGAVAEAAKAFLSLASKTQDEELRSRALNNACALLNDLGHYGKSRVPCQRAVAARRRNSSQALPRALNNLAVSLQGAGDAKGALHALEEALEINRLNQDWDGVAANLTNLAINDQLLGQYSSADKLFTNAITICEDHFDASWSHHRKALATLNRAGLLERLGRFREALALLGSLLDTSIDRPTSAPMRATAELNRGVILRNLGDPHLALSSFKLANLQFRELGSNGGVASVLLNSALAYHHELNDSTKALELLNQALPLAQASSDSSLELEIVFTQARVYLDRSEDSSARASFDRSLRLAEGLSSGIGRWSALTGLAEIDRKEGDFKTALARLEQALQLIEEQAQGLDRNRQSSYLTGQRTVYEAAIGILLSPKLDLSRNIAMRDAFLLVQRFKGSAMTDSLRRPDEASRQLVAKRTGRGEEALQSLRESLHGALLIDYFAVEGRLLAWTLSKESLGLADIGSLDEIGRRVAQVVQRTKKGNLPHEQDLLELGNSLVKKPLEASGGLSTVDELILAPDGFVWQLPFDVLLIDTGSEPTRRLIEHAASRQVPHSLSLVHLLELKLPRAVTSFEGWALDEIASRSLGVSVLTNANAEIEMAATAVGGSTRLFNNGAATELAFVKGPRATLIRHLATHTRVDDRAGLTTSVVLAPSPSAKGGSPDRATDGFLSPADIAQLSLPAQLTVLAACATSGEPSANGDGALGTLAGAFLVAGSRAVLATLWAIDDQTSAAFLEQFYYHLGRGESASDALRSTKLLLASDERWSNPRDWAGWVLIGDSPTIPGRSTTRQLLAAGLVGTLVLTLAWWLTVRFRQRQSSI